MKTKFVRQARLPKAAYNKTFADIVNDMQKTVKQIKRINKKIEKKK